MILAPLSSLGRSFVCLMSLRRMGFVYFVLIACCSRLIIRLVSPNRMESDRQVQISSEITTVTAPSGRTASFTSWSTFPRRITLLPSGSSAAISAAPPFSKLMRSSNTNTRIGIGEANIHNGRRECRYTTYYGVDKFLFVPKEPRRKGKSSCTRLCALLLGAPEAAEGAGPGVGAGGAK